MIKLGFAILSHSNRRQLSRMTKRLTELFDGPPIVCHHDFSKCQLDRGLFTNNVQFVEPFIVTKWGKLSVVRAGLAAIRLLYSGKQPPDWFYLLSGSDYPVRSPESIIEDLANSRFDVFIDNRRINYELAKNVVPGEGVGFNRSDFIRLAYKRYCALRIPIPSPRHPWRGPAAGHIDIMNPALLGPLRLFSNGFECFAGEHWFTANRKAAEWLFSDRPEHTGLLRHYKHRSCVDESFYHCIFGNARSLNVSPDNRRYVDWSASGRGEAGKHPKNLGISDLPLIRKSGADFARKFAEDSEALEELDRFLGTSDTGRVK